MNGHFTASVIDSWGERSDENIKYDTVLSFDAQYALNTYVTEKVNKQAERKLGIIDIKSSETREATYTCRCTSEYLIPNSVMGIDWSRD